jgi:hypothetical protein
MPYFFGTVDPRKLKFRMQISNSRLAKGRPRPKVTITARAYMQISNARPAFGRPRPKVTITAQAYMLQLFWSYLQSIV